jgi:hypothetical protein
MDMLIIKPGVVTSSLVAVLCNRSLVASPVFEYTTLFSATSAAAGFLNGDTSMDVVVAEYVPLLCCCRMG